MRPVKKPRLPALPHIGQRMLKTSAAVFACLALYCFLGYRGADMPTEAAITAIICMQPYVQDSRNYALNRLHGTLIGASWGLLFLLLLLIFPFLGYNLYVLYALMSLGVLMSLYTAVAVHKPDTSGLSAIVFICVVISFPEIENPVLQAAQRITGVLAGTGVAIGINLFHLPRSRDRNCVFFIRSADLVLDRFSHLTPAVLFRLNSLLTDGAKICLISRHAPAFFISQLGSTALQLPMIVMDGAALYDASENRYLWTEPIREKDSALLLDHLSALGLSCFLYTVHRNKTCIFHRGQYTEPEQAVMNQMRRSPYRSYLDEEIFNPGEIVSLKLIGEDAAIRKLEKRLQTFLRCRKLRSLVQPQSGIPGICGLYIYSKKATVSHAENRLMALLREEQPNLRMCDLISPHGYRSEHDAMLLLYQLKNLYAPIRFLPRALTQRRGAQSRPAAR